MFNEANIWDRFSKGYAKSSISDEESYRKKLEISRRYFRPEINILEFGCGTGGTAISHAPFVKHVYAIDISSNMISYCNENLAKNDVNNVSFSQSTIDEYQPLEGGFGAVLGLSILHLLPHRQKSINKVYTMLKPGGYFISSTICLGESMKFMRYIAPIGRFIGLLPTLKVFTSQELTQELTDAGFEIDYKWQPTPKSAVFIVAKKPDNEVL